MKILEEKEKAPLAAKMRPRSFEDFVGQEHIIGPGKILRKAIESDRLPSMLFWGPPGTGKTTLALLIAKATQSHFELISAVSAGVADLRRVCKEAEERLVQGKRTILFIDEVHRFNKAQQEAILPFVENGTIIFIGATTENPSFEVVAPLLSRCRVFTLKGLSDEEISLIVTRALKDEDDGLGGLKINISEDSLDYLVLLSNGDARIALNALEISATATEPDIDGFHNITPEIIEEAFQSKVPLYDKAGEEHYNTISAFIKSMRGSSPDGAIYWLCRMLEAGEDPLFIARRLVILAAEDVGLADPQALPLAVACQQAVHFIGLPEAAIPLAETTIYLASAPKSNTAYKALKQGQAEVRQSRREPVPLHLRNAVTSLMKKSGYGKGYKYAHDYPEHFTEMDFLPSNLKGHRFYQPSEEGFEKRIAERLRRLWGANNEDHP